MATMSGAKAATRPTVAAMVPTRGTPTALPLLGVVAVVVLVAAVVLMVVAPMVAAAPIVGAAAGAAGVTNLPRFAGFKAQL